MKSSGPATASDVWGQNVTEWECFICLDRKVCTKRVPGRETMTCMLWMRGSRGRSDDMSEAAEIELFEKRLWKPWSGQDTSVPCWDSVSDVGSWRTLNRGVPCSNSIFRCFTLPSGLGIKSQGGGGSGQRWLSVWAVAIFKRMVSGCSNGTWLW